MRRITGILALSLLAIAATPSFGGWVVITVHDLPATLEAGRPATLAFTMRQHGRELLTGRSPTVTMRREGAGWLARRQRARATPAGAPGVYEAVVTPTDTGTVVLTIDADFHGSRNELLPIAVVPGGGTTPPPAPYERGRSLFVAKGCVTCHARDDDEEVAARHVVSVGPALGGRRFAGDWLAAKLADPATGRVRSNDYVVMPELELTEAEITALVAYVNGAATAQAAR